MDSRSAKMVFGASLLAMASCIPATGVPATGGATGAVASAADGKSCGADGLIDDGEDGNNQVAAKKGRNGYWYTFADKAGSTITPPTDESGGTFSMTKGGANGSTQAAHANGKIGSGAIVYAGFGFNFIDPKGQYNASAYKGIAFWAKAAEPTKIRVKLPDVDTDPDGKACKECFNDFGMDIDLTTTWTRYVVPFSTASQMVGWGSPRPASIDPSKIYGVQFQVNTPGTAYDVSVDDIEFTGCP